MGWMDNDNPSGAGFLDMYFSVPIPRASSFLDCTPLQLGSVIQVNHVTNGAILLTNRSKVSEWMHGMISNPNFLEQETS